MIRDASGGADLDLANEFAYLDNLIENGDYGQQEWAKAQKAEYIETYTAPEVEEQTTTKLTTRGDYTKSLYPDEDNDRQTIRGVESETVYRTVDAGTGYNISAGEVKEIVKDSLPDLPSLPSLPDINIEKVGVFAVIALIVAVIFGK